MNATETPQRRTRGTGRPPGRPTKLTAELTERICEKIRLGCPPAPAAVSLGIAESTYQTWMRDGQAENAPARLREFVLAVKQALAECHATLAQRAANDPKFTVEVLARRFRQDWAREDRSTVDVNVQLRPAIDPSRGTLEQLQNLRELLAVFTPNANDLPHGTMPAGELLAGIVEGEVVSEEEVA